MKLIEEIARSLSFVKSHIRLEVIERETPTWRP